MGHYDDMYDDVVCGKCEKTVPKYGENRHGDRLSHRIKISEEIIDRFITFKPYNNSYLCGECYKEIEQTSIDNKEFSNGTQVEIKHKQYEFFLQNKRTGQFARGIIDGLVDNNYYNVKLLCDGETHKINKRWLFLV